MRASYADIRSRIPDAPTWYDENGTPRYEPFDPRYLADIYARRAVLMRVQCVGCGELFDVAISQNSMDIVDDYNAERAFEPKRWAYGDPPNHRCVCGGDTMSADEVEVLQVWERPHLEWMRRTELEG